MKKVSFLLILFLSFQLLAAPVVLAGQVSSGEAQTPNFWQEADIIFWQTMPFSLMWGYFVLSQASGGGELNLHPVLNISLVISGINALLYASRVVSTSESPAILTE